MSQSSSSPLSHRHFRVRLAALLYFASRSYLLALLVAGPVAYWRFRITDPRLYGAAAAGSILLLLLAHAAARRLRCVACGQPVLRHAEHPKHAYAAKWLGLSYRARVAWDVLTHSHHHCMYCHTRCRNAAHGSRGSAMPVTGFARQETITRTRSASFEEAGITIPPAAVSSRPSIFDTALLTSEAVPPALLPIGEERVLPRPGQVPVRHESGVIFSAPPPLPSIPAPFADPAPPIPAAHSREAQAPVETVSSKAAPLPLSPFLPSAKPSATEAPPPLKYAPTMTTPVPPLTAFPFSSAVVGGPVPAPHQPALPAAPAPLLFNKLESPAVPLPSPVPAQTSTPSPFLPPSKPVSPAKPMATVSDSPFLAVSPSPPVKSAVADPVNSRQDPILQAIPVVWPVPHSVYNPPMPPVMESAPPATSLHNAPVLFAAMTAAAPVLPPATTPAPALPMESVVEILQQGRQTMDSAFLAMIEQLRGAISPVSTPAPAPQSITNPPVASIRPTSPVPVLSAEPAPITITVPAAPAPALEAAAPPFSPPSRPGTESVIFSAPPDASFSLPVHDPASFNPFAEFAEEPALPALAPLAPPLPAPAPANLPPLSPSPLPAAGPAAPPIYPPLHPVAVSPAPLPAMPQLPQRPLAAAPLPPSPNTNTSGVPVRRRPLPAINPDLLAELGPTLQQAFTPPPVAFHPTAAPGMDSPVGFPSPIGAPGAVFPAFPAVAAAAKPPAAFPHPLPGPAGFPLPPMAVLPGNSFAPTPGAAFTAPAPAALPDSYSDAPPPVPAPFSFLQPVAPAPAPWPTDGPADLPSAADSPPMWTRTRGKPSLS